MSNVANNFTRDSNPPDIGSRLPPGIREQLTRFHQLRQSIRVLRGISGWCLGCLTVLLATILLDAFWVSPSARPLASSLFYTVITIAAWIMVIRPWLNRSPDWLADATQLERRSSRVRNLLVAAVELASMPVPPGTSQAFSTRVQSDAEQAIVSLDIGEVVSKRPRRKAIRHLQIAAALLVAGCLAPWIQLPSRMARIVLPWANLGRSSWVSIQIIQPLPRNKKIAQGDIVVVQAQFSGPWQGQAEIETRWSHGSESHTMVATDEKNVAKGAVSTDLRWLEYRVTSQNAASPWYRLDAFPRPSAGRLVAQVQPPSSIANPALRGFTADLSADQPLQVLRGSRIALRVHSNFRLAIAELQWRKIFSRPSTDTESQAHESLSLLGRDGTLRAEFIAEVSRGFRIHLVDADTALSNRFSSTYEIEVIDDEPAKLSWLTPETTDHLVAPDDVVELNLSVSDELPLTSCEIRVRTNGKDWRPLADVTRKSETADNGLGAKEFVRARVDLTQLAARYGDLFEFEGIARDAAGHDATSRILRMTVVADRSQPLLGPADELQFDIANRLDEFAIKLDHYAAGPARQSLRGQELVTGIVADLQQLIGFALSTAGSLQTPETRCAIRFVGANLANVNAQLATHLSRLQKSTTDSPKDRVDVHSLSKRVRAMAEDLRAVLAVRIGHSIAQSIRQISGAQQEITARAGVLADSQGQEMDDGVGVLTLTRMQRAVFYQVENVQLQITDAASRLPEKDANILAHIARRLDSASSGIRREAGDTNIRTLLHNAAILNGELLRLTTASGIFPDWTGQLNRHLGKLAEQATSPTTAQNLATAIASSNGHPSDYLLDAFSMGYEVRRSFRRATQPGDRYFASDMGLANRAARAQADVLTGPAMAQRLTQIQAAAQTLLATDIVEAAHRSLSELSVASIDRSPGKNFHDAASASDARLLAWSVTAGAMPAAHVSMGAGGYSHELTQQLIHLSGKMQDGALQTYVATPALPDAALNANFIAAEARFLVISDGLASIQKQLEQHAIQARSLLRSLAPSVVDLAQEAARRTRLLSLVTGDLAGATLRDTAASVQSEVQQLSDDLARPAEAVEQLRDALIDLAESQDLLDANQIETAKLADQAREQVDVASDQLNDSLADVDTGSSDTMLAQQLRDSAEKQLAAAERLENVAAQLSNALPEEVATQSSASDAKAQSNPGDATNSGDDLGEDNSNRGEGNESSPGTGSSNQPGNLSQDPASQQGTPSTSNESAQGQATAGPQSTETDAYRDAEELAEFARKSPEEMLAELEAYLPTSSPMQRELSTISQDAALQALDKLVAAQQRYEQLSAELRLSDIATNIKSQEMRLDATFTNIVLREVSMHLLDQARAAMVLAKDDDAARSLERIQQQVKPQLELLLAAQPILRNSLELSNDILPENTMRWIESQRSIAQTLTDIATQQLDSVDALTGKAIHSQPRELKAAAQDASDRLRRTTQMLARVTRGHKRIRTQQLEQAQRRVQLLSDEVARAENTLQENPDTGKPPEQVKEQQNQQRQLARNRSLLNAQRELVERLEAKVALADTEIAAANEIAPLNPQVDNPAAQLAGRLLTQLRRQTELVANQLSELSPQAQPPRVAEAVLRRNRDIPDQAGSLLSTAAASLERAMRHEQRLGSDQRADRLAKLSRGVKQLASVGTKQVAASFSDALTAAGDNDNTPGQVPESESSAVLRQTDALASETAQAAARLSAMLNEAVVEPQTQALSVKPPVPMQPDELASLLDQLDRQLNEASGLGQRDNDSNAASSAADSQPQQLSNSASQIAQSLAMGRQPPSEQTSGDLAMATESQQADVRPQGPTAVQMLDVERLNGLWGELRERTSDDALEDARLRVPAQYRSRVDAYFRRLGTAGESEVSREDQ